MSIFELMLLGGGIVGVMYYIFNVKKEHGFVYGRFPIAHKNLGGSFANPGEIHKGYKWTSVSSLKSHFSKSEKRVVKINHFVIDDDFAKKCKIPTWYRKKCEETYIYFDPVAMRKSMLFIGKMGTGKTEILFSFLTQKFYNRAIIHQLKAGDFVEPFYRKKIDIILNPYDQRGHLWDIMSESEGTIKTFFNNYLSSVLGDKKDFFSSTADRLFNETMTKIKIQYNDQPSYKKWLLFIQAIKEMFAETEGKSQNSKKDVASTMESIIEPLEIMAWQMQDPNQKTFTIKEFFERKNRCKLFLDNNPEFIKQLTPLFSAFLACTTQIHTSLPDSTTDFTLYALDEYLSLSGTMDDESKKRLHTAIRSKAGILMAFIQYVPNDDKKMKQMLTSSAYAWFYFSVIEEDTINLLKNTIGETEYFYEDINESHNNNGKSKSYSTKKEKTHLISNDLIHGLGEEYEHIVYLPDTKMIYKAYTPRVKLKKRAEKFVRKDLTPFYQMKYKNGNVKDASEVRNLTFEDLFKEKPISKVEQYRLFKKYEKAMKDEKELAKFKKDEQLENVNFELLFEKFIPKDKIIDSKMKILSAMERLNLATKWAEIDEDDYEKQVEFIEKYDLWGATPYIFNLMGDENIDALEDDFDN